jgi:transposase
VSSAELQQQVVTLERELQWARLKIEALQAELRLERIRKYGPQSETLSCLQLELLESEPGVSGEEAQAEAGREALPSQAARERKPHPGRQALPKSLPRVIEEAACADRACRHCGAETTLMGYDESEQLDVEPARYFVRVVRREKRSCRACDAGGVVMAELAPRIVEKGLASDRVIVETVTAKYCDHLPLPAGSDAGARGGAGDQPRNAGWLGDAGGRVIAAGGQRDAQGPAWSGISAGR